MHVRVRPVFPFSAAAIALLAACSGGASTTPAPGVPLATQAQARARAQARALSPMTHLLPALLARALTGEGQVARTGSWAVPDAAKKQHVYVSDPSLDGYYGAVCYYAGDGGAQLGCLAGGASSSSGIGFPEGSWVDRKHHLWVANGIAPGGYTGLITEYALPLGPASVPINSLYSTVGNPSEGAFADYVCGDRAGNVYGTSIYTATTAVWRAGTQNATQTSTLVDPNFASAGSPSLADGLVACATDAAGDLFVSGQYAVGSYGNYNYFAELDEFVGGAAGSGTPIVLQKETSDLYFPAGVAIDKQGNLAWALFDLSDSGSSVCTFAPPYTGSPTACTTGFATGFHFAESGKKLWGGNTTVYPWYHEPQATVADEIAYPGGGLLRSTSGAGLLTPVDASVNPALEPPR